MHSRLLLLDEKIKKLQTSIEDLNQTKEDLKTKQETILNKQYRLVDRTVKTLNIILEVLETGEPPNQNNIPQPRKKQVIPEQDRLPDKL